MGKNGILSMGTDELYEVDGVVFDADSYARYLQHCKPNPTPPDAPAPAQPQEPSGPPPEASEPPAPPFVTFYAEPQHVGWYPSDSERDRVPMMSGALPPAAGPEQAPPAPAYFLAPVCTVEEIRIPIGGRQQTRRIVYGGGSGSYVSSFTTSFTTSYLTTYRFGSGSGSFFSSGSCIFAVGGYGLELI